MPANHGLRANDMESLAPPSPPVGEPHPEETIAAPELRPLRATASSTSCCRSARFSSARSVRVLSDARSAPNRAKTRDIVPWLARRSAIVQSLRKDFGKRHHVSDVVGPQIFEENVADDGPGVEPQSGCLVVGSADAARGALRAIAPRRL